MDFRSLKLYKFPILLALSCIAFYFTFAYGLERSDFLRLIGLYAALFYLSFKLIQMQKHNFRFLAGLAIIFRLVFIVSFPELSQDYFRFIWDGRLIAAGMNPYQFVPHELIQIPNLAISQAAELIEGMGSLSTGHYSNYAPLNQLIFAIAGWFSAKSMLGAVVIFRTTIILADLGTLFFGRKLLKSMGLPEYQVFWYILNPFIIIEMTGNLHFEAVMVFFLIWSLYLLHQRKWIGSAVIFGLSVSVKLLPLLFLPLLFKYFTRKEMTGNDVEATSPLTAPRQAAYSNQKNNSTKKSHPERSRRIEGFSKLIMYYLLVFLVVIISFLPFYSSEIFSNFLSSVGLWFGKFEFNASIYYIIRWIGFQVKGYNIIETAGMVLPIITFLAIMVLSFFRKFNNTRQLTTNMLFAVSVYLLLSTTVHPWYLAIPLMLSVFTQCKYMIIWSATVMLSYYAYSNPEFQESYWLIALEYLIVFFFLGKDLLKKSRPEVA